jgi:hypothetical protein
MTTLRLMTALALAMTGCLLDHGDPPDRGGGPIPDPGQQPPSGGGTTTPPKTQRGPQKMSDVHVEPGGERVWIVHHAVADVAVHPNVTTAHLGVFVPETREFVDVLDTTGTLGKRILFPGNGRVLYVTQRGTDRDVFALVDAVARKPLAQRSYPGDRDNFRMSPTGRAVLSSNKADHLAHLLDTASLVDRPMSLAIVDEDDVVWAPGEDLLYALQVAPATTQLVRYDLRTADLSAPLPPPTVIATDPGFYGAIAMSADGRYLGVVSRSSDDASQVVLIDATTRAAITVAGDAVTGFTRDGRAIVWQTNADSTQDFRLVDPVTGLAAETVVTGWLLPTAVPLRDHDLLLVDAFDVFVNPEPAPFLYHTADGTRTPSTAGAAYASSMFERPGHDEVWMWFEYLPTLRRFDLATGALTDVALGDDSVDYRAATDDIVIGSFAPSLRRLSMATGKDVGPPLYLTDPNDLTAHYQLDDQ